MLLLADADSRLRHVDTFSRSADVQPPWSDSDHRTIMALLAPLLLLLERANHGSHEAQTA
jgi:hypothetical protein